MTELERLKRENEFLRKGLEYYADESKYAADRGEFWQIVVNRGQIARMHLKAADMAKNGGPVDLRKIRCD